MPGVSSFFVTVFSTLAGVAFSSFFSEVSLVSFATGFGTGLLPSVTGVSFVSFLAVAGVADEDDEVEEDFWLRGVGVWLRA